MAEKKRAGIYVNADCRPGLMELVEKLKAETGIVFNADLVYQALRRWYKDISRSRKPT